MSMPATDAGSTASACCNVVITTCPIACNRITDDGNSSDVPNTSEHSEQTSLIECCDVNAALGSSRNDSPTVDDSVTVAGSAAHKMCNELEPSVVTTIEPRHPTEAADELTSSVAQFTAAAEPVSGPLQSTSEQCQSDVVTFDLPLEVIGACWFMKPDTATCLQATTSNDGLFSHFDAVLHDV